MNRIISKYILKLFQHIQLNYSKITFHKWALTWLKGDLELVDNTFKWHLSWSRRRRGERGLRERDLKVPGCSDRLEYRPNSELFIVKFDGVLLWELLREFHQTRKGSVENIVSLLELEASRSLLLWSNLPLSTMGLRNILPFSTDVILVFSAKKFSSSLYGRRCEQVHIQSYILPTSSSYDRDNHHKACSLLLLYISNHVFWITCFISSQGWMKLFHK